MGHLLVLHTEKKLASLWQWITQSLNLKWANTILTPNVSLQPEEKKKTATKQIHHENKPEYSCGVAELRSCFTGRTRRTSVEGRGKMRNTGRFNRTRNWTDVITEPAVVNQRFSLCISRVANVCHHWPAGRELAGSMWWFAHSSDKQMTTDQKPQSMNLSTRQSLLI